jgi:hypothetical protein
MNAAFRTRPALRLALAMGLSLLLASCANSPIFMPGSGPSAQTGASGTADPRLTQSDEARFFSKSGWQACLIAAGGGALACQLSNASNKDSCMLKAAVVACGVAMGANYYLDQRRADFSNREQRLDVMINDVREDNRRLASLNQTARTVIAEDRSQLEQLQRDIATNKVQKAEAAQQLASIDANTQYLRKTLADLKAREKQWTEVAASERANGARVDSLDAEISRMRQQIASLESEIDTLFQQRSAIKVS